MSKQQILQLVTHNGLFHADEVTAVALLHLFDKVNLAALNINRTRDTQLIEQADIALDVGAIYDLPSLRFDHHQIVGGSVSSAGLVWSWIKQTNTEHYPEIDVLIKAVDAHDCGVAMMPEFSFPDIIAAYNSRDPLNDELQLAAFHKAVQVALTLLQSLIEKQQRRQLALKMVEQAAVEIIGSQQVLMFPEYCKGWAELINGQTAYKHITHVIWYVEQRGEWCVQIPAVKPHDFTLAHARLQPDSDAKFVHQSGFFAVYKTKESLFNMLHRQSAGV